MSEHEYTVTQKEAADFLNVSTKSISRYRKRGLPYKLILNPVTGKQEVRFRYTDLERWHEGRQLLANYARDGEEATGSGKQKVVAGEGRLPDISAGQGFLAELLVAYKEQIELLRDQLEDMREQLGRRDRQIDDLMRLMVGLQLEYKPMPMEFPADPQPHRETTVPVTPAQSGRMVEPRDGGNLQTVVVTESPRPAKKAFSREQLTASILRLRRNHKSYDEIARALNRIDAATLSGQPEWTVAEVKTLLPPLVDMDPGALDDENGF